MGMSLSLKMCTSASKYLGHMWHFIEALRSISTRSRFVKPYSEKETTINKELN